MDTLKNKKIVVFTIMIAFFVVVAGTIAESSQASGEELIIRSFLSSGAVYERLIMNGWAAAEDTDLKLEALADFDNTVKLLFTSHNYSITKSTAINTTTITAKGLIKPKVTATITLIEHNSLKTKPSNLADTETAGKAYLVLSIECKDSDVPYSFLKATMKSFLGDNYHQSIVISGFINGILSPQQKDIFVEGILQQMDVQNMETLADGPMVSITGYSPGVRNVLTVAGKSVNINMALRYSKIDNKTRVYVGSPVITSEY